MTNGTISPYDESSNPSGRRADASCFKGRSQRIESSPRRPKEGIFQSTSTADCSRTDKRSCREAGPSVFVDGRRSGEGRMRSLQFATAAIRFVSKAHHEREQRQRGLVLQILCLLRGEILRAPSGV